MRPQILTLALFCSATSWISAAACDTPVYRYAMYRWEASPYELFFFHNGPITEAQARVHGLIQSAQTAADKPANLSLLPVDLSKDPDLKTVPPPVRDAWRAQKEAPSSAYLVYTPAGQQVFAGDLDEAGLRSMLSSPAREEITKQLADGKAGVLVLVTGPDKKANAESEKLLRDVIQEIAEGKIPLYTPAALAEGPEDKAQAAAKLAVGWVKVARDDPRERWLVEALLSTEDDLKTERFAGANMVFPVFGRGRALPPCVDKGVTRDNLIACVDFVTGACSCTVKDQNPGVDLLIAHDWMATAEKLAERFGTEEGNESHLGAAGLFPQLMIPAGAAQEPAAGSEDARPAAEAKPSPGASTPGESAAPPTGSPPSREATPQEPATPSADSPSKTPQQTGEEEPSSPEPEAVNEDESLSHEAESSPAGDEFSGVFQVGAGVAVALVLLFGLTFFILRPR